MNILKDRYLLEQSQSQTIKSEGEEVNLDVGLNNNNNNIIFGPMYSGFDIVNDNVFPPATLNMEQSFLSNGATLNNSTGYVENLGTITVNIYIPKGFAASYNMQINYVSGSGISNAMLTVNSTSKEETFYQTYNWNVENGYVFYEKIQLVEGKNVITISAINGKPAPWIGTITFSIADSVYSPQFYATVTKITPPAANTSLGFIGGIGINGAYILENVDVPYTGEYIMYIAYITGTSDRTLNVDVNGVSMGAAYTLTESSVPWGGYVLEVPVALNKGSNTLKFYTDNNKQGPWIGPIVIAQEFYNDPIPIQNATLLGSSNISNNGFIVDSGFGVGDVTLTLSSIPATGSYNFLISYYSPVQSNNVYIYVNGKYIGTPQAFQVTDSSNAIAYEVIPITLNKGANTIVLC